MTTYLGKSCSFCLPRVPFVNCRQFMYLVISLLVLRAGYGMWLYQFLIIAYLFTLLKNPLLFSNVYFFSWCHAMFVITELEWKFLVCKNWTTSHTESKYERKFDAKQERDRYQECVQSKLHSSFLQLASQKGLKMPHVSQIFPIAKI